MLTMHSGHPPRRQLFETPLHRINRRLPDHRTAECERGRGNL
jgi:hypothetical protein